MKIVEYVAVLLVYRNIDDLSECVDSILNILNNCKIIVVNAYFDNKTKYQAKLIAQELGCEFINIDNLGYSYGNNVGIKFALDNYLFSYIIIANPDTVVKSFSLDGIESDVIAPCITNLKGKRQNPLIARRSRLAETLEYIGFKNNILSLALVGVGIYKLGRVVFLSIYTFLRKKKARIYAPHGSFIIISFNALYDIAIDGALFDENMFLFAEENVLAYLLKAHGMKAIYTSQVQILHKEDGSIKLAQISQSEEIKKSNLYFYEHYIMHNL